MAGQQLDNKELDADLRRVNFRILLDFIKK